MKKNIILVLLITLLIILTLVGCDSSSTATDANSNPKGKTELQKNEKTDDNSQKVSNLKGKELLESIDITKPRNLTMELKTSGFGVEEETTTLMYIKGENSRIECEGELGEFIIIYIGDEKTTYQYTVGHGDGMVFKDEGFSVNEDIFMVPSLDSLVEDTAEDLTARLETLDNEEVVYLEITDIDEENRESTLCLWFSPKYGVPLKYEVIAGDKVAFKARISNINTLDVDDKLFEIPNNIKFVPY